MSIKRIGVLTSGGDAPGMNAAIRAVVRSALNHKLEVMGVIRGYAGLVNDEIIPLNHRSVSNIINQGGTILKTSRCPEFMGEEGQKIAIKTLKKNNIDALVLLGGDGTYRGGEVLFEKWGILCIGVPCTIDNDLSATYLTIGADTAINTALSAIDNIRDTATSLERIFVVEVMGRELGYIAMQVALAGGCEEALLPEKKYNIDEICHSIAEGNVRGKASWIIVVAEGAGSAQDIADKITAATDLETRVAILGHIQRGGRPTATDRVLASRMGACAVEFLAAGKTGCVGIMEDKINLSTFSEALKKKTLDTEEFFKLIKVLT